MTDFTDDQLNELKNVPLPEGLDGRIISAVRREVQRQRRMIYFLDAVLISTVAASFLAVRLFLSDLSASPVRELLGLAWTDGRAVLNYFSDWMLAVVESTPIGSLTLTLGAIGISIFLLDKIIRLSRVQLKQTRKAV